MSAPKHLRHWTRRVCHQSLGIVKLFNVWMSQNQPKVLANKRRTNVTFVQGDVVFFCFLYIIYSARLEPVTLYSHWDLGFERRICNLCVLYLKIISVNKIMIM